MAEICRRLDGMPLAIELAAARVRALSLTEIVDSLHDRFRLLTGGSRTAVRRQQTLRASVDWSHALLTETERILFRRLAVFLGGFDLDAAQRSPAPPTSSATRCSDQLTLLVDKSLVVAENTSGRTRYRLLETVRQYALEKLGESGEADAVRSRHRDHYTAMAALLDAPARSDYEQRLEQAEIEMDNLRACARVEPGKPDHRTGFDAGVVPAPAVADQGPASWKAGPGSTSSSDETDDRAVAPAVHARALCRRGRPELYVGDSVGSRSRRAGDRARARRSGAAGSRTLSACGSSPVPSYDAEAAATYFAEATESGPDVGRSMEVEPNPRLAGQHRLTTGDPIAARAAGRGGPRSRRRDR